MLAFHHSISAGVGAENDDRIVSERRTRSAKKPIKWNQLSNHHQRRISSTKFHLSSFTTMSQILSGMIERCSANSHHYLSGLRFHYHRHSNHRMSSSPPSSQVVGELNQIKILLFTIVYLTSLFLNVSFAPCDRLRQ
jgi:hypothetical protein